MKLVYLLVLVLCQVGFAGDKVIYGEDDRLDLFEVNNNMYYELAKSTAAMISTDRLKLQDNIYSIKGKTLRNRGICSIAKFSKQMTAASCSGFLVGDDLLVTAGHCVTNRKDCRDFMWVFDFKMDRVDQSEHVAFVDAVYKCKKIIERKRTIFTKNDYALIRLERKVLDRSPLRFRTRGKVKKGTPLVVIGHPSGLPTKVAAGAVVKDNWGLNYFKANLDTFGGNSGSAVFDANTGVVEGILVRGDTDYIYDRKLKCNRPKVCSDYSECLGEGVTRITNIIRIAF